MSSVVVVRVIPTPLVGTCGEVRDRRFDVLEADLDWLEVSGVPVERLDPTSAPGALASLSAEAVRIWESDRSASLPMVVIDGRVVSRGTFLPRSQLAHLVAEHRRLHSLEIVRQVAALGATAAIGADEDLRLEEQLARALDMDDSEIEAAIEAGRHVAHHDHASAFEEAGR